MLVISTLSPPSPTVHLSHHQSLPWPVVINQARNNLIRSLCGSPQITLLFALSTTLLFALSTTHLLLGSLRCTTTVFVLIRLVSGLILGPCSHLPSEAFLTGNEHRGWTVACSLWFHRPKVSKGLHMHNCHPKSVLHVSVGNNLQ